MSDRVPDRRRTDRSSPSAGRAPHVPTPRPRPRSLGAMVVAAVAGVAITVASSAIGRCDGRATTPRAGPAATVTPAAAERR